MSKETQVFINELGNPISITVETNDKEVLVSSTGPNSHVEHTWTKDEASWLATMLTRATMGKGFDSTHY